MSGATRDQRHRARTRSRSPTSRRAAGSSSKRSRDDDYAAHSDRRMRSRHDSEGPRDDIRRDGRRNDHDRSSRRDGQHRHRHHHHSSSSKHTSSHDRPSTKPATTPTIELPYSARPLSYKTDLDQFRPILARYLDVQKQRDMYSMDEREVRGRWKSFVNKWNSAELASGWYDPDVFATAVLEDRAVMAEMDATGGGGDRGSAGAEDVEKDSRRRLAQDRKDDSDMSHGARQYARSASTDDGPGQSHDRQSSPGADANSRDVNDNNNSENDDDDDDYGPTLPGTAADSTKNHAPSMPNLQDLALRRELAAGERSQAHTDNITQLRAERKADRTLQKERLEELAPRADPGSHARKMEKKREVNDKMRSFRDRSPGLAAGVDDRELMGDDSAGGAGDLAELKKQQALEQRRKTEREIRREEEARAREEEREERLKQYRDREDRTMEVLKEIARQRFG